MRWDRIFWAACALGGALVVVGCLLPGIEVAQVGFVGDRGFRYTKTVRLATYERPGALLFLVGGMALVALSAFALVRGSRSPQWLTLIALAISIAFLVEAKRISDDLVNPWSEDLGVFGCSEPLEQCVPFIARAIRDLQAEIRTKPEAQDPAFELLNENGYQARGRAGWTLIVWSSIALGGLTLYRVFRFAVGPILAALSVAVTALLVFLYWLLDGLSRYG